MSTLWRRERSLQMDVVALFAAFKWRATLACMRAGMEDYERQVMGEMGKCFS